jgi:hypothetical protein
VCEIKIKEKEKENRASTTWKARDAYAIRLATASGVTVSLHFTRKRFSRLESSLKS